VHISHVTAVVESSQPVREVGLPKFGPVQATCSRFAFERPRCRFIIRVS
jgi:hypothetical protein